jgi:isopentenyldiphosphate isomerase
MHEEFFDIYDEKLNPIGTASRRETHAKGYWHRTFHCWLARRSDGRELVLFQRRQLGKDTNPDCYDITAAGHLLAGEGLSDAVRELEEELGVSVSFQELIYLDQVREEADGLVGGKPFIDREVSEVYGLITSIPLESMVLQQEEVAGVYEAEISDMLALFRGERDSLTVQGIEHADVTADSAGKSDNGNDLAENNSGLAGHPSEYKLVSRMMTAGQFVPRPFSYYINVLEKLQDCIKE